MIGVLAIVLASSFLGVALGCVFTRHLETPDAPRAEITAATPRNCALVGVFEGVGETQDQAQAMLQIRVHEAGGTHVTRISKRDINQKRSANEALRNNTSFSPLYRASVAEGSGYRCR